MSAAGDEQGELLLVLPDGAAVVVLEDEAGFVHAGPDLLDAAIAHAAEQARKDASRD